MWSITYRIPITGLKVSTNKIYEGIHWSQRKQHKDSVASYAAAFCKPIQRVESYPVAISYRFIFRSRPLDTLNCAFMAKMFEDAFRAIGILKDDSPPFVASSLLTSVVAPSRKGKAVRHDSGKKDDAENEDWLEITINPYTDVASTS